MKPTDSLRPQQAGSGNPIKVVVLKGIESKSQLAWRALTIPGSSAARARPAPARPPRVGRSGAVDPVEPEGARENEAPLRSPSQLRTSFRPFSLVSAVSRGLCLKMLLIERRAMGRRGRSLRRVSDYPRRLALPRPDERKGVEMMNSHPRLVRSLVPLKVMLLLATLISATAAQGADRKVLLENFTSGS